MVSTETDLSPEEFYRTNHMALVAFLRMEGHSSQSMRWEGGTCYWYFDKSDVLLELCDRYHGGTARVEPKEYNRVFGIVREELFDSDQFSRTRK